jgi:hypothetical protein
MVLSFIKHSVSETGCLSINGCMHEGEKVPSQLGPLETTNLSHSTPKGVQSRTR